MPGSPESCSSARRRVVERTSCAGSPTGSLRRCEGLARLRRRRFLEGQARVRGLLLASDGDIVSVEGSELPARWLREFMAYDPAHDLPAIRCPILAVTGSSDVQVDPDDVERMRALVTAPFDGETPATLTHLLRRHAGRPGLDSYPAAALTAGRCRAPRDGRVLDERSLRRP